MVVAVIAIVINDDNSEGPRFSATILQLQLVVVAVVSAVWECVVRRRMQVK